MDQAIRHGSREKYMEGKTLHVSEESLSFFDLSNVYMHLSTIKVLRKLTRSVKICQNQSCFDKTM